jgi:O-antigen/teichoic acid export membrane protein
MLVGVIAIPFLLKKLGVDRLGVLTLIWALIGYFSIFDFGLGRALTYRISSIKGLDQGARVWDSARSGIRLLFGVGIAGGVLATACVTIFGIHWLNVSTPLYEETKVAVLLSGVAIPVTTITSGLKGILEGLERFQTASILRIVLGFSNFLVPVAAVALFTPNLALVVAGLLLSRLIVMLLHVAVLWKSMVHFRSIRSKGNDDWKELARFGAWMTVSNVLSPFMVVSDRFFISHLLGSAVVAYYAVPNDFLFRLLILPAALTTTLFPVFAQRLTAGDAGVRRLYLKALRSIAFMMLPITIAIMVFAHFGMKLWLGGDFADHAYLVVIILTLGIFCNSLAQIPHAVIQASGDAKRTSLIHVTELVVYMPILILAVIQFGIFGAACVWSLRVFADLVVLHVYATRVFHR